MSINSKANSFLSGLIDEPELKKIRKARKPKVKGKEWIVYFIGEKPDCVWSYDHNPADGIPYGKLEGYFDSDVENGVSRHYVENHSKNLKLMDYNKFIEQFVPNKGCAKFYDCEEDFILDML